MSENIVVADPEAQAIEDIILEAVQGLQQDEPDYNKAVEEILFKVMTRGKSPTYVEALRGLAKAAKELEGHDCSPVAIEAASWIFKLSGREVEDLLKELATCSMAHGHKLAIKYHGLKGGKDV